LIRSREDFFVYLKADRNAMGRHGYWRCFFIIDPIWAFVRLLRKVEYFTNCKISLLARTYLFFLRFRLKLMQLILGFTIPPNVLGPGLNLPHYGTIVIHNNARIGSNCRINVGVVIGENNGAENVPTIGNNVVIESGAKIFGKIEIADGIHIGANSVVNKSFTIPNIILVGAPARIIKGCQQTSKINDIKNNH
jgi:serine O-acetyltransferase